jgi:hypothetical protein
MYAVLTLVPSAPKADILTTQQSEHVLPACAGLSNSAKE